MHKTVRGNSISEAPSNSIAEKNSFYFPEVPIFSDFVRSPRQSYGFPFSWPFSPVQHFPPLPRRIPPLLPGLARPPCEDPVLPAESLAIFEASALLVVFSPQLASSGSEFNGRGKLHAFTEQR